MINLHKNHETMQEQTVSCYGIGHCMRNKTFQLIQYNIPAKRLGAWVMNIFVRQIKENTM